ncbi:MAG: UDP-N-acetylmuramoyl-L-alanine--D-glutamate ligase [Clostridiales bacterium]|nr:UDP-N-acetylmuramoyl-L-alanine--D-glutamate ligase [Clostridiales bacterium]
MFQCVADYFRNKKVLILGFGREGRSSYNYIRTFYPRMPLTIADLKDINFEDENVQLICGEKYLDSLEGYDIVLKSPGISFKNVRIPQGVEVTCQTDLFLRYASCVKVGITGTKGKTTTSTLIYEILCTAGVPACLIGNMGVPVFDCLSKVDGKTAVIEMSSHQLEFTHTSPHIAVLTNIYEEHLDHYNGFEGYVNAKLNIFRNQTENDYFIYNADQEYKDFFIDKDVKSKVVKVSAVDNERNELFKKLDGINVRLIGSHNKQDAFFAAAAARCLGINDEAIEMGIRNFKGIPHRMEPIGTYEGIKFYNDSIATIPHAVMCALEALKDVDTLIIGGMDRGLNYSQFALEVYNNSLRNLICLPETGHRIAREVEQIGSNKNIICVDTMEQAVEKAFEVTKKGYSCILSPAAASYNRYKDFEEKGAHYISLVRSHG